MPCGQQDFHCPYSPPGLRSLDRVLKLVMIYNYCGVLFSIPVSADSFWPGVFLFHIHGFVWAGVGRKAGHLGACVGRGLRAK